MDSKVGDVVCLRSGGPLMTIVSSEVKGGMIKCQWFDGSSLKEDRFPEGALALYDPKAAHREWEKSMNKFVDLIFPNR